MMLFARHRRLGAVGDHLDGIDEVLALRTQALEAFFFGQVMEGDMPLGGLTLGLERRDLLLKRGDALLELGFAPLEGLDLERLDVAF